jgi:hypothetical protein
MKKEIFKVEHIWWQENDRWIYIEKDAQMKIIGINFMQGNEYEYFKESLCTNNPPLFKFYEMMLDTFPIEKASVNVDTMEFINKCIWAYHHAVSLNNQYN